MISHDIFGFYVFTWATWGFLFSAVQVRGTLPSWRLVVGWVQGAGGIPLPDIMSDSSTRHVPSFMCLDQRWRSHLKSSVPLLKVQEPVQRYGMWLWYVVVCCGSGPELLAQFQPWHRSKDAKDAVQGAGWLRQLEDWIAANELSSYPHHDIYTFCNWQIFWHSIWQIFWRSIWQIILAFYLANHSGILSGKSSGILSGKSSGILSGKSSGILSGKSSGILSGKSSGILSGKSSGILSGKSSGILSGKSSGILSGKSSGILSGKSSGILSGKSSGTFIWQIFLHSIWQIFWHSTNVKSWKRLRSHVNTIRNASLHKMLWTQNPGRVVETTTWQQKKERKLPGSLRAAWPNFWTKPYWIISIWQWRCLGFWGEWLFRLCCAKCCHSQSWNIQRFGCNWWSGHVRKLLPTNLENMSWICPHLTAPILTFAELMTSKLLGQQSFHKHR